MLGTLITNVLITAWRSYALGIYGWPVADRRAANARFAGVMAVLHKSAFRLALSADIGAVTKRNFGACWLQEARCMLQ